MSQMKCLDARLLFSQIKGLAKIRFISTLPVAVFGATMNGKEVGIIQIHYKTKKWNDVFRVVWNDLWHVSLNLACSLVLVEQAVSACSVQHCGGTCGQPVPAPPSVCSGLA